MARATTRDPEGRMSLGQHFKELRNRLLISCIAIAALAVVGWYWYDEIFAFVNGPIARVARERGDDEVMLRFQNITEPFAMQLRVAVFSGIVLASPVWIWQVWAFLLPGLHQREKKIALVYFFISIPLFFAGAAMAAFTFPRLVAILLGFTPEGAANLPGAQEFLSLWLYFMLAFGLAFLLPVVLVALNQVGILSARNMRRSWRVTLFAILVFSAFMTPDPSAWTMLAMAAPVFFLFWCAVGVAFLLERRRERKNPGRYAGLAPDQPTPLP
ncbi:twin-arginine translocase subunit TatC [Ornithinimicrobium cerasi]|uniref:Sec-independent protein translocase protein TatC n=1 Tax=Ornithinimicrobium cerasi TaxID=2248773 RepID=A0A285VKN8_9MICO|nr:twin-arginine translocase subunit TatC [Ornithinimicrobium cerasi]SOC54437.1 sec-independent protein translocase protein TatC [Ornithinimicrobium cerasi]